MNFIFGFILGTLLTYAYALAVWPTEPKPDPYEEDDDGLPPFDPRLWPHG